MTTHRVTALPRCLTIGAIVVAGAAGSSGLSGCASDEPGHTKTTTKTTVDTPTERKTITETHEKDTRYVAPRN